MELGCTYLIVTNMARSIAFYESLLNKPAESNRIEITGHWSPSQEPLFQTVK